MVGTVTYEFSELPMVIDLGFEAGLVNGSAEISYFADGEWSVSAIYLDGHKKLRPTLQDYLKAHAEGRTLPVFEEKPVALDAGSSLHLIILDRLEHRERDAIQEMVNEAREADASIAHRWDDARDLMKHARAM